MPLKSRYKLSNSTLLGLGCVVSTGTLTPFISLGDSSTTLETILGYFLLSQRKAAGTLRLNYILAGMYPMLKDYNAVRTEISGVQAIEDEESGE